MMVRQFLKRRMPIVLILALATYLLGYIYMRTVAVQRWDKDGHDYLIFPKDPLAIYYIYRPLSWIDGRLTGMRFHIGPHES